MNTVFRIITEVNKVSRERYKKRMKLYQNILKEITGTEEINLIKRELKECEMVIETYDYKIRKMKNEVENVGRGKEENKVGEIPKS